MVCTVIVDGFFGDAGKGKVISYLAVKDGADICVRGGVGPNAGHTVVANGKEYKLRMVPSGFTCEHTRLLIGPGVVINPDIVLEELKELDAFNRFGVDKQAAVIEAKHIEIDSTGYLKTNIGTTGTGTGPCNADRAMRTVRLAKDLSKLQPYIADVPFEVNEALDVDKTVIVEGTQGTFLSLYHGTYPYVTSKDVTASSICADVGIGPTRVDEVILVFKSFVSRVGEGDLPGELPWEETVKRGWDEVATVTGRKRRAAPFNFELAKRAVMLNGATQIALTKVDVLYPKCRGVRTFAALTNEAKEFVNHVGDELNLPVSLIGTGPDLREIVDLREKV